MGGKLFQSNKKPPKRVVNAPFFSNSLVKDKEKTNNNVYLCPN